MPTEAWTGQWTRGGGMIGEGSDGAAAADPARGCPQVTQRSWIVLLDLDILHDSDIDLHGLCKIA